MTDSHRRGEVRLRSNVVLANEDAALAAAAWELVPGEIIEQHKPHFLSARGASRRQRAEHGYYLECSYCDRLAHQTGRDGCDDPRCLARPSETSVAVAKARQEDAAALIRAEREHLETEAVETERDDLGDLLEPERAVARFLGLAAMAHAGEPEPELELPALQSQCQIVERAKRALVDAASRTGRFVGSYCESPLDNLVDTLSLGQARAALDQVGSGDGGELKPQANGSPKFCAAYSSAALAVNTFAAWSGREPWLALIGRSVFTQLDFEVKFPIGLAGRSPNLDVVASAPGTIVAIESKCVEYLGEHDATFQPSYDAAVEQLADASWTTLFRDLTAQPALFGRLGVGQLVRHYLGLRRAVVSGSVSSATLLYLFWEPNDAARLDDLIAHRADVVRLARRVDDPTVSFAAMSYPELWNQWTVAGAPEWLVAHVEALRERYAVTLTQQ